MNELLRRWTLPVAAMILTLLLGTAVAARASQIGPTGPAMTPSGAKTSNGATAVVLMAAPTSGPSQLVVGSAEIYSTDTVTHTVSIISSGGTELIAFQLGAGNSTPSSKHLNELDNLAAIPGEGISFKIDAAGVTTSVHCSAMIGAK